MSAVELIQVGAVLQRDGCCLYGNKAELFYLSLNRDGGLRQGVGSPAFSVGFGVGFGAGNGEFIKSNYFEVDLISLGLVGLKGDRALSKALYREARES